MHKIESLNISSSAGAIPNTFFRQQNETHHLAVLLPGLGYTSHMPVLYYPCLAFLAAGADIIRADYNYIKRSDFMALEPEERRRLAAADASAVLDAAMKQQKYDRITLVGKSIGTAAMGHLITSGFKLPGLHCIWLTPLLKNEKQLMQIKRVKHRALFVVGTADPYYDQENLNDLLESTGGEGIVIEGADHSLEIAGDPIKSLQTLERIMKGIVKFAG